MPDGFVMYIIHVSLLHYKRLKRNTHMPRPQN